MAINTEPKNPEMIFTDREQLRDVFWNAYDDLRTHEHKFYVINYHGTGGYGKSRLCRYLYDTLCFKQHPNEKDTIDSKSFLLDFEDLRGNCDIVNVLVSLANKFVYECGYRFKSLKAGLTEYYIKAGYSMESPEIQRIQDYDAAGVLLELAQIGAISGKAATIFKVADMLFTLLRRKMKRKNKNSIFGNLSSDDIKDRLLDIFVQELEAQTQSESYPVVAFLDTYEQFQKYNQDTQSNKVSEEWIWSNDGLIPRVSNVLWVIAGQMRIDWAQSAQDAWGDEGALVINGLEEIKDADQWKKTLSETLSAAIKEGEEDDYIDHRIIDKIIDETQGVPFHVALCKDVYVDSINQGIKPTAADFEGGYEKLARRFVGGFSTTRQEIVYTLACLEFWNEADIADLNLPTQDYRYISQLSFIKYDERRKMYYMHHRVQTVLYEQCDQIIKEKCNRFFEQKLQPDTKATNSILRKIKQGKRNVDSLTTAERQDYILKKMELQLEYIKEKSDAVVFLKENMKYIREYLFDFPYFKQMVDRIEKLRHRNVLERWLLDYFYVLDVYLAYHHAINGDIEEVRKLKRSIESSEKDAVVYGGTGMLDRYDRDTKEIAYFVLGSYEYYMNNYIAAKEYYLEAYKYWQDSADIRILLDIVTRLGTICAYLKQDSEAKYYCDEGLGKLADTGIDSKTVVAFCELIDGKSMTIFRSEGIREAKRCLTEAESILHTFDGKETENISTAWAIIYKQYFTIYHEAGQDDLAREYAFKQLDASKKAYEFMHLSKKAWELGDAYINLAYVALNYEELKEYLNKAVELGYYKESSDPYMVFKKLDQMIEERKSRLDEKDYLLQKFENYKNWNEARIQNDEYHTDWAKKEDVILDEIVTEDIDEAIDCCQMAVYIADKLYTNYPDHKVKTIYVEACDRLANVYDTAKRKLTDQMVRYIERGIEIAKELVEESQDIQIMRQIIWLCFALINDMEANYAGNDKMEKLRELFDEELKYSKMLYENQKTDQNFLRISYVLSQMERCQILTSADYDQIRQEYEEMIKKLDELNEIEYALKMKRFGSRYMERIKERARGQIDSRRINLEYDLGRILYIQRKDLETAKRYILSYKSSNAGSNTDKYFYIGKINAQLLNLSKSTVYMTREEGIALLNSEDG